MDEKIKQSLDDDFETDYQNGDAEAAKNIVDSRVIKKIILEFKGIDDWNRPIFKLKDKHLFYGDTVNLFSYSQQKNDVLDFYKENSQKIKDIIYFGQSFGCEPSSSPLQSDLKIILE